MYLGINETKHIIIIHTCFKAHSLRYAARLQNPLVSASSAAVAPRYMCTQSICAYECMNVYKHIINTLLQQKFYF